MENFTANTADHTAVVTSDTLRDITLGLEKRITIYLNKSLSSLRSLLRAAFL